jgi:hypothetical protein
MVVYYGVGIKGVADVKTETTFEIRAAKLENPTNSLYFCWCYCHPFDDFIFDEIASARRLE